MTAEHIWPQWLEDVIPRYYARTDHHVTAWNMAPRTQRATKNRAIATTKRVCGPCNSGWMSQLEQAVKPLIVGPIAGRPATFDAAAQTTIATWAIKTAMTLGLSFPGENPIPSEHYRLMAAQQQPPPNTTVLTIGYTGREYSHIGVWKALSMVRAGEDKPDLPNTYVTTISAGHFVFQVLGSTIELPELPKRATALRAVSDYIWPLQGKPIQWPPGPTIGDEHLLAIAYTAVTGTYKPTPDYARPS